MRVNVPNRQPYATLDLVSCNRKALKIERLLNLATRPQPMRLLEVGTGSGGIAHYFAAHPRLSCEVSAVDVVDNRLVTDDHDYKHVQGVELPFPDAPFDVVITNHVIEHVGDVSAQARHLAEIRRVMRPDGVGYVAVPNRWMLTEPHYRLMFPSWWPRSLRTSYLRLMRKGVYHDCEPLQLAQLERMFAGAGFHYRNLCVEAWREIFQIERPGSIGAKLICATPDLLLKSLQRIIPTLIYRIERTSS